MYAPEDVAMQPKKQRPQEMAGMPLGPPLQSEHTERERAAVEHTGNILLHGGMGAVGRNELCSDNSQFPRNELCSQFPLQCFLLSHA